MAPLSLFTLLFFSIAALVFATPPPQFPLPLDEPIRTTEGWSYVDCGSFDDVIVVQSIKLLPDPPQPGKDLTVTVSGKVKEVIENGAYAEVLVKLGLVKLLHKTFDVCDEARKGNVTLQCPVNTGSYTVNHTVKLPREIPRVKFGVSVQGYTVDHENMFCLDLKVDFMKHPFLKLD